MITVGALIEFQELRSRLIAGLAGTARAIRWAHVSELTDPTPWLEGGELIMTTGIGVPRGAEAQVAYLDRLARNGVAGLAVGDQMYAPPLTPAFLATADQTALPVILVDRRIPFIALAQRVAAANRDAIHERLANHLRVYEAVGQALRSPAQNNTLVEDLEHVTGFEIFVVDPTGNSLFPTLPRPDFELGESVLKSLSAESAPYKRIEHVSVDRDAFLVPLFLRSRAIGVVIAVVEHDRPSDYLILHHVATALTATAAWLAEERERTRRHGSEVLASRLFRPRVEPYMASDVIPEIALDDSYTVALATVQLAPEDVASWEKIHNSPVDLGTAHALTRSDGMGIVAAAGTDPTGSLATALAAALPNSAIGVSAAHSPDAGLPTLQVEAESALLIAISLGRQVAHFGERVVDAWFPVEPDKLEVAARLLTPLVRYDEETGSELTRTLEVFLEENRSSKAAATRLIIHRQTLSYRLRKIEALTDMRLSSTDNVCAFWIALKARHVLEQATVGARRPRGVSEKAAILHKTYD